MRCQRRILDLAKGGPTWKSPHVLKVRVLRRPFLGFIQRARLRAQEGSIECPLEAPLGVLECTVHSNISGMFDYQSRLM